MTLTWRKFVSFCLFGVLHGQSDLCLVVLHRIFAFFPRGFPEKVRFYAILCKNSCKNHSNCEKAIAESHNNIKFGEMCQRQPGKSRDTPNKNLHFSVLRHAFCVAKIRSSFNFCYFFSVLILTLHMSLMCLMSSEKRFSNRFSCEKRHFSLSSIFKRSL